MMIDAPVTVSPVRESVSEESVMAKNKIARINDDI